MILKFEGHMEFVDLVNEKKDAGYQDFLIFFTDGVVEYYLGAPAGQVSEPLFFEILVYFLGTAREYEKANKIFEKHLSKLPESPYIKSNLEKIISEISAHKI